MALEIIQPCTCTFEDYLRLHPEIEKHPGLCPRCKGTRQVSVTAAFDHYRGKFSPIDWEDISERRSDIYYSFKCKCGDDMVFGDIYETKACSCGRIYRFSTRTTVDETHVGDIEFIKKAYQEDTAKRVRELKRLMKTARQMLERASK